LRKAALPHASDLPVLIVEDDIEVRAALGDLLARWGVPFESAADATEAISRVDEGGRYCMVLADYRLPGELNGLDLITEILQRHPSPPPAPALITADFDSALISAAHARSVPLLHKPVGNDRLWSLLSQRNAAITRVDPSSA
jgi:DNA-binding NtrC family response regulator